MEKFNYLANTVAIADFKPADQYVEVYNKLHAEWEVVQEAWNQFKSEDVVAFQNEMQKSGIGTLIMSKE